MSKYDGIKLKQSNWTSFSSLVGRIADLLGIGDEVDGMLNGINSDKFNANKVYNETMNKIIEKYSQLQNKSTDDINKIANIINNFGPINSTALKGRIQQFKTQLTNDLRNKMNYDNKIASSREQATNLASAIIGTKPSTAKSYSEQINKLVDQETDDLAKQIDRRI